jgi:hypothetical protein
MRSDERQERCGELRRRQQELNDQARDRQFTREERDEFEANAREIADHEKAINELETRRRYLAQQAIGGHLERGAEFPGNGNGRTDSNTLDSQLRSQQPWHRPPEPARHRAHHDRDQDRGDHVRR